MRIWRWKRRMGQWMRRACEDGEEENVKKEEDEVEEDM